MHNIIYAADVADDLNDYVISKLSPRLFLFYKYNPHSVNVLSADAKFIKAINNLYKLMYDTGCIANKMWYILTGNTRRKDMNERYSSVYQRIEIIRDIRTILNHNNNSESFFNTNLQSTFKVWCSHVIGKEEPDEISDYESMNCELEKYGEEITKACKGFIDDIVKSQNKDEILDRWIDELYRWYGNKREIFYSELDMELKKRIKSDMRNKLARMNKNQIIGILNEWIEDSYYCQYEDEIDRLKKAEEELIRHLNSPSKIKRVREVTKEKIDACEASIDCMEEEVIKKMGITGADLKRKDFVNLFFIELTDNLKKIAHNNIGLNLAPEVLMQEFIRLHFKGDPVV